MMRRNEAALKTRVNTYEEQLRRVKMAEAAKRAEQPYIHQFESHDSLPTEEDYEEFPADYDPTVRRKPDPRVEDRKKLMAMVNQKRETVADMQSEAAMKREKLYEKRKNFF